MARIFTHTDNFFNVLFIFVFIGIRICEKFAMNSSIVPIIMVAFTATCMELWYRILLIVITSI